MPTVSAAQHRAMEAAAHGHSTLGIPKKVGEEFVAADAKAGTAAGTVYVARDGSVLMLRRSGTEQNYPDHWALPGGKADAGETAEDAREREAAEETGNKAPDGKAKLLDKRSTPNGMIFHTFAQPVEDKFEPRLNAEHSDAGWFSIDELPRPIHPSVRKTFADRLSIDDVDDEDWPEFHQNFASWARSDDADQGVAEDAVHSACGGRGCKQCGWSGVANTNYWPMKPNQGAPLYAGAHDEWNEGDHPRKDDGKFGSGSSAKSASSSSKSSSTTSAKKSGSSLTSQSAPISMADLSKKGGKLGSNEGGLYEGKGGEKFYIKKPQTKAHVKNERQAAALYQLAGAKTLDYRDVEGGEHVASEWKQLEKKNISEFTPAERKEAAKDFAIHAWLSNWDAAGTGGDNQGVLGGKTTTLDVGGSLRFRAQGGPKGSTFGDKVAEFDTMRDKGMSPDAARLFAPMSEAELKESVQRVTSIPDDKIRATVGDDKELADRLIARKKDLGKRVGIAMDAADQELAELAYDRAPGWLTINGNFRQGLAYDRQSVRTYSKDGHLHVEEANISKACVNPYLGKEIPKYRELGLEPDKVYKLLRHPEELKKGASTFNGKPLLSEHVGITSDQHRPDLTIGSTGTHARYEHPYLKNALAFWPQDDIDDVEANVKKELSSAYHYRADMTPGTYEGEKYDGVMRDIVGNHVALVKEGRAGSDVVVGDSKNPLTERKFVMSKKVLLSRRATVAHGALMVHLAPLLAKDSKLDLSPALKGVTSKNFTANKPRIVGRIEKLVAGKLAQDGSIKEGLEGVLSMIEGLPDNTAIDEFPETDNDKDDDDTAEDEDNFEDGEGGAADEEETDEEKAARLKKAAKDKKMAKDAEAEAAEKEEAGKKAMDTAIAIATDKAIKSEREKQQAISQAKEHVRPRTGNLTIAFDSAEAVYLKALELAGKDVGPLKKADAGMLKFAFDQLPAPHAGNRETIAMDGAPKGGMATIEKTISPTLAKNLQRIGSA